jgi:hypothetical protein
MEIDHHCNPDEESVPQLAEAGKPPFRVARRFDNCPRTAWIATDAPISQRLVGPRTRCVIGYSPIEIAKPMRAQSSSKKFQ